MTDQPIQNIPDAVEAHVAKHQPVDQEAVEDEFGQRGLSALRELMRKNVVSYDANWNLVCER